MKRALIGCLATLLLSTPLVAATTVEGSVNASNERVWSFVPFGDGQTLITLSWGKKNADLFVVLICTSDSVSDVFGVGAAFQDRVQRVEAGAFGEVCSIAVASFKGSSSFRLSVESGAPDDLTKLLRASDPGTAAVGGGKLRLIAMDESDIPGLAEKIERIKAARR